MQPIVPIDIDAYCATHSSPPSALLQDLYEYTNRNCADPQMLVGPLEAALLQMLVRLAGARQVLEIGTYTGYSALAMAEALPVDGRLLTCEIDPDRAAIARTFFARSDAGAKIELRLGPALTTVTSLPTTEVFDLAFIDADKENYLAYYDAVLPRLKPGALLVADNTLWSGRVLRPAGTTDRTLAEFNRRARQDARVTAVLLPVRDGVTLIRKA